MHRASLQYLTRNACRLKCMPKCRQCLNPLDFMSIILNGRHLQYFNSYLVQNNGYILLHTLSSDLKHTWFKNVVVCNNFI